VSDGDPLLGIGLNYFFKKGQKRK